MAPGGATRCRAGTAGLEGTVGLIDEAENLTKAGFLRGRGGDVKWAAGAASSSRRPPLSPVLTPPRPAVR